MTLFVGTREEVPEGLKGGSVLIGHFDGVHRGHSVLIGIGRLWSGRERPLVVLSFYPHARRYFSRGVDSFLLQSREEKLMVFERLGVDGYCEIGFDEELSRMSPEAFVRLVCDKFLPETVVVGKDFRFGKDREGSYEDWRLGGVEVCGVETLCDRRGRVVSSTKVRECVKSGDMEEAAVLLGRWFGVVGEVERGEGIGSEEGVATANVGYDEDRVRMAYGVYVVRVSYEGLRYFGVGNVGVRPTIGRYEEPRIEVHLFGCEEVLYGKRIHIEFLRYVRGEKKFATRGLLFEQIGCDIEGAKDFLRGRFGYEGF